MRGLQGAFPRWKKRLPSDHFQRRLVIEAIVLIHNYCTELVGFNQISTVFDSKYVHIQNLEVYDRIAQYYFRPGEYNSDDNDDGNSDGSDKQMSKLMTKLKTLSTKSSFLPPLFAPSSPRTFVCPHHSPFPYPLSSLLSLLLLLLLSEELLLLQSPLPSPCDHPNPSMITAWRSSYPDALDGASFPSSSCASPPSDVAPSHDSFPPSDASSSYS